MPNSTTDDQLYDVIIVGSGPAGNSAAFFLSQAGKRVFILEKDHLPRYKACGGGLSPRYLREQFPFAFETVAIDDVQAISYIHHRQMTTVPLSPGVVGMVMRDDFDAYLLRHSGAQVAEGTAVRAVRELSDRVEVETKDGRIFSSRYLIGADGANSIVAHSIGLRKRRSMAAAIEVEVAAPPDVARQFAHQMAFIFGEIHYGYLWIFSKSDHLSVGIVALHPKPGELQHTLQRVMARHGISLEGAVFHGHPIPIYTRRERISSARTLLVGDAAGLADPLSGEGIRFAIKSGRMAAETILSGHPERYTARLQRSIGLNHHLTMLVSLSFYYLQELYLFTGTSNPYCTAAIVEMMADRINAAEFVLLGILTLPAFALTELSAHLLRILGLGKWSDRIRAAMYPPDVRMSSSADIGPVGGGCFSRG
jgi:geranylgeranyl reductase family protein